MDLRHVDPRMGRGDHDLRVMPGSQPPPAGMNVGMPPMQPPPAIRPQQPIPDMDALVLAFIPDFLEIFNESKVQFKWIQIFIYRLIFS